MDIASDRQDNKTNAPIDLISTMSKPGVPRKFKATMPGSQLLVIVHPGSACGSADMNLGRELAETQRLDMQILIEHRYS